MDYFLKLKLFSLLSENSQEVTNEEMQCAYGKFVAHIDTISQVGNELTSISGGFWSGYE